MASSKKRCLADLLGIPCTAGTYNLVVTDCENWSRQPVVPNADVQITSMTYNPLTNIITLTESNGDIYTVNIGEFELTTNILPNGNIQLLQGGVVKATIYRNASDIIFDNTGTGLSSTNVQDAIEELKTSINGLGGTPHKETSYGVTAPSSPQLGDRRVDTSGGLPGIDKVWNGTSWVAVVGAGAPVASNVVGIPSTGVTNQGVGSFAQTSVTLTAPVGKTFDYIEYFTNGAYGLAVFNGSGFTVTSNKSATPGYDQFLYYDEYGFLGSNKGSYITYGSPTSATITLYVSDSAAVASINGIGAVHYK